MSSSPLKQVVGDDEWPQSGAQGSEIFVTAWFTLQSLLSGDLPLAVSYMKQRSLLQFGRNEASRNTRWFWVFVGRFAWGQWLDFWELDLVLSNRVIEVNNILAGKLEGSGVTFVSNSQVAEQGGKSIRRRSAGKWEQSCFIFSLEVEKSLSWAIN